MTTAILIIFALEFRPIAAGIYVNEELDVDGTLRSYRMVIPHSLPNRAPVVFAFHGMGDSTESMANYSRLDRQAARSGFILVYPAARKSMWSTVDIDPEKHDDNPDVRFFDNLIEHLSGRFTIDQDRVYLVGMSNGATFVQILAAARPQNIAALVAHSGPKPPELNHSAVRVPTMLVVGEHDSASSAVRQDAEQYRANDCLDEFVMVPNLGHEWSVRHNADMWGFLSRHKLQHKR